MILRTCSWCGRTFSAPVRSGPAPRYCRPSHRQRAYEARRKAASAAPSLEPDDVLSAAARTRKARTGVFIRVLGPVEVLDLDGRSIPLGPAMRGVLATLALRPRQMVTREKLLDDVWPGVPDRLATRRLHTAMWKLRTALEPRTAAQERRSLIRWSDPGYVLEVSDGQLDWTRFRRLRVAGESALGEGMPHLAASYFTAALSLWNGGEVLGGIDVPPDDLGFVAERIAGKERATRGLIEARFQLGDEVVPEVEAQVALDPLDDQAVRQLAIAYFRAGQRTRALGICKEYLEMAADSGGNSARRIEDLWEAILSGRLEAEVERLGGRSRGERSRSAGSRGSGATDLAFLSAAWTPFTPRSSADPLAAELHLIVQEHGGAISHADDRSVEASFSEIASAVAVAIALEGVRGGPAIRIGIDVQGGGDVAESFDGPPRARARLLAAAARDGQVLVSGGEDLWTATLPAGTRMRLLGDHRLNAIGAPVPIAQLRSPSFPFVRATPRWFDRSSAHNIADEPSRFFGRDRELAEIAACLVEGRLVTLKGPPGSGKTRLASHLATGLSEGYADGVWFVPLQSLDEDGAIGSTLAEVLRMPRPTAVHLVALARYLRDKRALIVLDNCEHLVAGCRELVDALLPQCRGITILATSREALRWRSEEVIAISPFEPPPPAPIEAVVDNDAVRLFLDRLGTTVSSRTEDEIEAVGRIARVVEGIPLALVLAAARASELGVVALAEILERTLGEGTGLSILSDPSRRAIDRQTLDGTMAWSYRLLAEREQGLFDSLSVFRSRFTLHDVIAVCEAAGSSTDDIVRGLDRLVQASMVTSEAGREGDRSFRLLQPVRDFASSKLLARDRLAAVVHRRHAEHHLRMAEDAEPQVRGPQDRATLGRLEAALPDLYAAIRWAIGRGEAEMALRIGGSLWVFWLARGRIMEGREMLAAALALDQAPSPARMKALVAFAQLSWFGGDVHSAVESNRELLAAAEITGDTWAWAMASLGLAATKMFAAEEEDILLRLDEVLPRFRELGNAWDTCQALQTIGGAAWHRGQYERAERAMWEAVELYRSIGHPTSMSALRAHGLMLALLGDIEAGVAEVDHSLAITYEDGDLAGLAEALCIRAAIARYSGDHELARRYYRDGLRMARDAGNGWMVQWALDGLGDTEGLDPNVPHERLEASVQLLARAGAMAHETGINLAPRERADHARDLETARARLREQAFASAFARGERLALDDAVELALAL